MDLSVTSPDIASGTFSGGPKDELATADIYKVKSSMGGGSGVKPITSIQELSASIDQSTFDLMLDAGTASDFMSKVDGGVAFDKDLLTQRILGTNSEFKSTFSELNEGMKTGALTSVQKARAESLMCTANNTKSMVSTAKIADVRSLGSFINKYTGTKIFSTQDKGALSGLLSSVVTTSSNLGIGGAFSAIASTVNDTGIIGRITRAVLPIAVANSDTKLLKEITTGPAASLVNVFSPGFTQSFSRNFTYRGSQSRTLDSFEDIFTSFRNVDSQWDRLNRGGEGNSALNLLSIMGGSKDFRNIVLAGVKYWIAEENQNTAANPDPLYALAFAYPEITVGQAIKRDFPKVALLSVYNGRLKKNHDTPFGMRRTKNGNIIDAQLVTGAMGALLGG